MTSPDKPAHAHDHAHTIQTAEDRLSAAGTRLTPLRRKVLELLIAADAPAKAYDLLEELKGVGAANPPTIYRTLNFLLQHQLIHKIESLNAYVACCLEAGHKGAAFIICETCERSTEAHAPDLTARLENITQTAGYSFNQAIIEVRGVCEACRTA